MPLEVVDQRLLRQFLDDKLCLTRRWTHLTRRTAHAVSFQTVPAESGNLSSPQTYNRVRDRSLSSLLYESFVSSESTPARASPRGLFSAAACVTRVANVSRAAAGRKRA